MGVYTPQDYTHCWETLELKSVQMKFGVNIVLYALLQEGGIYGRTQQSEKTNEKSAPEEGSQYTSSDVVIKLTNAIKEESERVIVNGAEIARGTDYLIDYGKGEITLLNREAMNPRADVQVRYEETDRKSHKFNINIYDTDKPQSKNDRRSIFPLQARISYGDGNSVYIMNFTN